MTQFPLGIYLIFLNVMLTALLVRLWPAEFPIELSTLTVIPGVDWTETGLGIETRYLVIVILAGALGSYVHQATSFADYAGNRQLTTSWGWWFILRPFIGSALATVFYFVIRGGLLAGNGNATDLSIFGIAAIAGLAGMFSKQAADKLREVFENLFKTEAPTHRGDSLNDSSEDSPKV